MALRHKRYAHTDMDHHSVRSNLQVDFRDDTFRVGVQMSMEMYWGGRDEWEDLVTFLDGQMHNRLQKLLKKMSDKTGHKWVFPEGPAPDWIKTPDDGER